ncbi:hypothetical protein [Serratia sp. Se-RSBMAAmG]|uniref:hypothetical protein n=1 Tax=Serratia sp. Se-RSBMAAmG TaxID=3043305 RepID=UPI0024AE89F9|nr:hypothetical protein [Serratia sp. Se-RSBMAAmG]MDI6977300.1 hypothetical protein [Serratia sp. Se-RSBMAAmG]
MNTKLLVSNFFGAIVLMVKSGYKAFDYDDLNAVMSAKQDDALVKNVLAGRTLLKFMAGSKVNINQVIPVVNGQNVVPDDLFAALAGAELKFLDVVKFTSATKNIELQLGWKEKQLIMKYISISSLNTYLFHSKGNPVDDAIETAVRLNIAEEITGLGSNASIADLNIADAGNRVQKFKLKDGQAACKNILYVSYDDVYNAGVNGINNVVNKLKQVDVIAKLKAFSIGLDEDVVRKKAQTVMMKALKAA